MNGTTRLSETWIATVPDVGYRIAGCGPHGDGKADVLWHHATRGEVWLWPMAEPPGCRKRRSRTVSDTDYRIVGTGDYDGDGKGGHPVATTRRAGSLAVADDAHHPGCRRRTSRPCGRRRIRSSDSPCARFDRSHRRLRSAWKSTVVQREPGSPGRHKQPPALVHPDAPIPTPFGLAAIRQTQTLPGRGTSWIRQPIGARMSVSIRIAPGRGRQSEVSASGGSAARTGRSRQERSVDGFKFSAESSL